MLFLQGGAGGFPSVAAEGGTIHVVWQDDSAGNGEIYYSHSAPSGSFTTPLNISRNSGISDLPRVVAHQNTVSIVWSDTSSGKYQVMLALSEDGGDSFGPGRVLSDGRASTGPPDIASQDSRLFVVWDETGDDGESRIVRWDSTQPSQVVAGSNRGFVPSIAIQGRRVIIAWHTDFEYKQRVYAVQSEDAGESFSEPILVSGDLQQSVTPSVTIAADGRSFIAWSDRTAGVSEIFLSSSDKDGQNYSPPKVISPRTREAESIFPVIRIVDDDDIEVAWATRNSIVSSRISAAAEPKEWARTLAVSDTAGVPRLAVNDGHPIVVWKDFRAGQSQIFISTDRAAGKSLF